MLKIGKLAKKAGVSTDSIRFYERSGLISAARRTAAGYRLYAENAVRQLAFIKRAQRCGFTLPEIRELLLSDSVGHATAAHELALRKKTEIEETMSALRCMHTALSAYIGSRVKSVPLAVMPAPAEF